MATVGRNISGEVAYIRDYFLSLKGENLYLKELIKDKENINKIIAYLKMPLKKVVNKAKAIIKAMELGFYKNKDGNITIIDEAISAKLEKELVLLLASIEDLTLVKIKELTYDPDDTRITNP